ncbi:hypothetical protein QBC40DRAFT_37348 [Triangularia verruculosa]|uniref:Uncharacterized protein n=1 Tax=Triangularia verruculosa TaxID=2587418 RepID=A0AAN6XS76_9PEZI|nr:hypothetical protein QBC40DRAFT_37348 [Triangularia verruculosa]
MMATESPKERPDEATITSDAEPVSSQNCALRSGTTPRLLTVAAQCLQSTKVDTNSQNVDVNRTHINGASTDDVANKHISDIDDLVNSAEVSVSGGSDNEASKEGSKGKEDGANHARPSSTLKKPASFKAISVNKTFLHQKGTVPPAQTKPLEKPAATLSSSPTPSSTLTSSRPRLVAKTGSGLVAKSSGANGGKSGSAPDANAVWNKNRPAPPPEPKKYTDEELKKYGIHMANRLGPEDIKGENNWADIEDDDEDWAPEAIVWADGTKTTISHVDDHHAAPASVSTSAPVAAQAPLNAELASRQTSRESESSAKTQAAAPVAPPATVPGPAPKTHVLGGGKGLVLKGAPEKPTLVAKPPPPPAAIKSPWAAIPKVEKVSPVAAPDLSGPSAPRYPPRDPAFSGDARLAPKEIAADDFSRSQWRDGPAHSNRELYNSQSGRYEPVADRRGPVRSDMQQGRQPALLHRPSHYDQQGPLEPSGAYPAVRDNEQPGPYGRRRGSSNVSGGSGNLHRLKNLEHPMPPPELINARRGSMTVGSDSPASPRNFSPSGGPRHPQGWVPRASPAMSHATPYHQAPSVASAQDAVPPTIQQSPLVPAASLVGVTEEDIELQKKLMRERRELALKRRQEQEAKEEAERKERIRAKLEAMGPAPESKSARIAAAKDHPPAATQPREPAAQKTAETQGLTPKEDAPTAGPAESDHKSEALPNGTSAQNPATLDSVDTRPHTHAHPWPNSSAKPVERYQATPTWGPPQTGPAKNVWGAPNNNRTLGNGTFVSDLGTTQLPHQLSSKPGPGPIAPPNSVRGAMAPTTRLPPIGPPRPGPRSEQAHEAKASEPRQTASSAWTNSAVGLQDELFSKMLGDSTSERERRLKESGRGLNDQPTIKDTWRPTKLDADGRRMEAAPKQTVKIGAERTWGTAADVKSTVSQQEPPTSSGGPSEYGHLTQSTINTRDISTTSILGAPIAPQQARGSRFFPSSRDVRLESSMEVSRPKSPSPPPPDMAGHPAFDGDVAHPHVSLPRPQPVVRLPPSAANDPSATGQRKSQTPSFSWAKEAAYKEPEHLSLGSSAANRRPSFTKPESAWQARFDSLLGGRKAHSGNPKSPSGLRFGDQPVDLRSEPWPTSPFSDSSSALSGKDGSVTTKGMAEDCFEEQEMGSLPPVRIPNTAPEAAWQPSPAPKPLPKKFYAVPSSVDSITFPVPMSGAGTIWSVSFPGAERKEIVVPHGRTRSNPRRGGPRGGRNTTAPHYRQGGKGRDTPSSSADQGSSSTGANPSHGRGNRGGYRGRDNWSRNNPAPIQT